MLDIKKIRNDFAMFDKYQDLIYFDNAATTFKPKSVVNSINDILNYQSVNIHRGDYNLSHDLSNKYDKVRDITASFINAYSKEIVFTSGASESLNLVARGWGDKFVNEGDIILTTEAEHASNILPWFKVASDKKAIIKYIPLGESGEFIYENFLNSIDERVKVVVIAHVTNVLGYVLPIKEICKKAHEVGAIVVCDGAQSVPHMPIDVKELDVDFLAFSAHKLCGPTGVGVLYGKYELLNDTEPFLLGGGSNSRFDMCGNIKLKDAPYKFEAGTPAIEGVIGLGEAILYLQSIGMQKIYDYEKEIHEYFVLKLSKLKNVKIYNLNADTGIVTFNVEGIFPQDVGSYLNSYNIAIRTGNHCAKILMDVLQTQYTIRASLYFYNTKEEIDRFVEVLKDITLEKCIDIVI